MQDLICLSTGKMASEDVAGDLLQAKHLGVRAFQSFSKKRLEANPLKIRFHDSMSKAILKTFKHMNKKVELRKETAKEIVLKADRTLFAQMIVIAEARQLSMKEVLSHPLGPLPWSLAAPDGSLKKIAKSSLAKELQKDAPVVESLLPRSAFIIDGMAMVQRFKGDHKTFREITEMLLAIAFREGGSSTRIDLVFDNYREISIKNLEREKRWSRDGCYIQEYSP